LEIKIPEKEASKIISTYTGANNYILDLQQKIQSPYYKLGRSQVDYVLTHHNTIPKIARKYTKIDPYFSEQLQEKRILPTAPSQVWAEKILAESTKAYHIWGKIIEADELHAFWIPKSQIVPSTTKKIKVDYSPFSHRPLMEHQKPAVENLLKNDLYILADDMGLGKTTVAIIANIIENVEKTLIICPASLKINWRREIQNYNQTDIEIVEGKVWKDSKYIIINYDILKNFHSLEDDSIRTIINAGFKRIIIDEAHYISNPKAQRTKIVNQIVKKIGKAWLLTGTPMTSRPINYYNLLKLVESRVSNNWVSYVRRYCEGYQFRGPNGRQIWNVNGASNLEELRDRTANKITRRLKEDVLDLPDKIITPIYLELDSQDYEKEMGEYLSWSDENQNQSISIHLAKLMKVRQIIATEKLKHTTELINDILEQDKKIIVFTNFTAPLMELGNHYPNSCVLLHGQMSKEQRQKSVDSFQNDPNIKIFISNLKAGGVGITLTKAEVVIMNDLSFVPSDHAQAEDRAFRIGQKKNVSCIYPIYENTIEHIIYTILQKKKNVIDTVMGDNISEEDVFSEIMNELHN
jgi:SWI/SNF-related matrix-associated actin-dependent regulator 1 of chromatin subfamily A